MYPLQIIAGNGIGGNATQTLTLTVLQAPGITSPAGTTFTAGQAGTFTVATTGVPNSTLSETGALPSGVTFKDNKDGTATLSGTPAADYGRYVHAHDHRQERCQSCRHPGLHPDGLPGVPDHQPRPRHPYRRPGRDLYRHDDRGAQLRIVRDGRTAVGRHVHRQRERYRGNLGNTARTGGMYPLQIIARNGIGGNAAQTLTLTVLQASQITSPAGATFTAGQAGTFTVTTTGVPNSTLSETRALPPGVKFKDNGDGTATLAGTPAAGAGGTYTFRITAKNGVSPDATQTFALTVNQAPGIASADHTTCTVRKACAFTVKSTGTPTPGLSETGALPRGVRFKANRDGTATLSGAPAAGTGGTYPFTIAAKNGVSPDAIQSFTLIVVGPPAAPSGLKATGRGKTVLLTWTNHASAPSVATAILIQRSTNAGFTTAIINTTVGPAVTTHIDKAVVKGKKYYYRVRAHNSAGNSAWSNVSNVTAP